MESISNALINANWKPCEYCQNKVRKTAMNPNILLNINVKFIEYFMYIGLVEKENIENEVKNNENEVEKTMKMRFKNTENEVKKH